MKNSQLFFSFFLSTIAAIVLFVVVGFYYNGANGVISGLIAGDFADKPFTDFYYVTLVFTRHILGSLYTIFPNVQWFEIHFYSLLILACTMLLQIFIRRLDNIKYPDWSILFSCILLFIFLFSPMFVILDVTRVTIFVSASALIYMLESEHSGYRLKDLIKPKYIVPLLIFLTSAFIRLEAGFLAVIVVSIYALPQAKYRLKSIHLFALPVLVLAVVSLAFVVEGINSDKFVHRVEPDIEYQIAGKGNLVPISDMQNAADSAKYNLAKNWIVNDPENISIEFLRSIIGENNVNNLKVVTNKFADLILEEFFINLLFILTTLFIFFRLIHLREIKLSIVFLIQAFGVIILLFFLALIIKIHSSIWVPVIAIATYLNLLIIMQKNLFAFKSNNPKYNALLMVLVLFFSTLYVTYIYKISKPLKSASKSSVAFINNINDSFKTDYLLIDLSASYFTYTSPFDKTRYSKNYIYMTHNLGALSLSDQYKAYLDSTCDCNSSDYGEFYDYLYSVRNNLVIIGKKESLSLTEEYLQAVYGREYRFQIMESITGTDEDIQVFTLAK